jgi:5-methyltetrahydrofolate corrinoid/iron sulfur protein methyltransferase
MIIAADNLNIMDPDIARAIENQDPEPVQQMVRRCISAGARAIDINSGPLAKNPEEPITFLVETVQEITDLPLLLDTTNPDALRSGLAVCRNPTIINGFSLAAAGLDMVLMNVCHEPCVWTAGICNGLLGGKVFSWAQV